MKILNLRKIVKMKLNIKIQIIKKGKIILNNLEKWGLG
jgi:hypothetical protein